MSLVTSRIQPTTTTATKSNTTLDPLSLLKLHGNSTATSTSTVLQDMLASASKMPFGEPVGKNTWAINSGVREIAPGPRSPNSKMNGKVNGKANGNVKANGHASDSAADEDEDEESDSPSPRKSAQAGPSSSKMIGPMPPTPSRKGKETATHAILHEDPIELSWPVQLRNRKQSAAGLFNPSMACYANATLQVLLHTPPVLRMAQSHNASDCLQQEKKGWCMLCALKKLVQGEHWASRRAYAPKEVHNHLSLIKKGFSKSRQEDTHEFFRFVTDALQNTALAGHPKDTPAKVKHTTWVYQTWGGEVRSRVVCSKCKKPSDTFDNFLDLSLDVPKGHKSIATMMQGFIKEDKLEGDNKYHCENCKSKANATKSFKILHAPPILTLHLKRFSVNYSAYGKPRANKNTQFVEYPESLDIAPYMVDSSKNNTQYRLFGVTCHRGSELRFGHYTSYVRGPQGAWFHADDEDMTPVSLSQVLRENSAYLLSYIRVGDDDSHPKTMPTSAKSSPLPARANGHANSNGNSKLNGHATNGQSPSAATSSPTKRKRQWADDDLSASDKGTPVSRKFKHPTPDPSDDDEEESKDETPLRPLNKWTYGGSKSKHRNVSNDMPAPRAQNPESLKKSPIDRPSHPGPTIASSPLTDSNPNSPRNRISKREEKQLRKKQKGAPMPFKQSQSSSRTDSATGFRKQNKGLKPRQQSRQNNRMFRG